MPLALVRGTVLEFDRRHLPKQSRSIQASSSLPQTGGCPALPARSRRPELKVYQRHCIWIGTCALFRRWAMRIVSSLGYERERRRENQNCPGSNSSHRNIDGCHCAGVGCSQGRPRDQPYQQCMASASGTDAACGIIRGIASVTGSE